LEAPPGVGRRKRETTLKKGEKARGMESVLRA
jgi:hypothetical protein